MKLVKLMHEDNTTVRYMFLLDNVIDITSVDATDVDIQFVLFKRKITFNSSDSRDLFLTMVEQFICSDSKVLTVEYDKD